METRRSPEDNLLQLPGPRRPYVSDWGGSPRASGVLSFSSHQFAAGETEAQRKALGSWDINTAIWPMGVRCRRQNAWVLDLALLPGSLVIIPEDIWLVRDGAPIASASGPGLALVLSTVPGAQCPSQISLCLCKAWLRRTNRKEPCVCHLLQETVGLGWSLLWWSSLGPTLPSGVR